VSKFHLYPEFARMNNIPPTPVSQAEETRQKNAFLKKLVEIQRKQNEAARKSATHDKQPVPPTPSPAAEKP
jgi:hypothetical protein